MFNFENSVTGTASAEKVWGLYSQVSNWSKWDSDVESVSLEGDFIMNNNGIIKTKNGQSLSFVLEDVDSPNSFINVSSLGNITVRFGHFIKTNIDDSCTITHTVTIDGGEDIQMENMGKVITANIPASMTKLLSLAI